MQHNKQVEIILGISFAKKERTESDIDFTIGKSRREKMITLIVKRTNPVKITQIIFATMIVTLLSLIKCLYFPPPATLI